MKGENKIESSFAKRITTEALLFAREIPMSFTTFKFPRFRKRGNTPIQTIKLVVFGLGGVGKTSLIRRFLFNKFDSAYTATIEDDYREVITYNNHIVDVTVLDTAGSYQFPAMRRHAIQHGHGFIIVYAVDNPASLEEAKRLYSEVTSIQDPEDCPIVLVGNKIDKSPHGNRRLSRDEVKRTLQEWDMNVEHVETSARINHNVSLVFNKLIGFIDSRNMDYLTASMEFSNNNNNNNISNGNLSRSTVKLNSLSRTSLNNKKSTTKLRRTFSLDDTLDDIPQKQKTKKKLLRKFFSRKTMR